MKVYIRNKEVKKILTRKNKSQNWFAYKLEISSGYMSHLMTGKRNPSPKMRIKILKALNRKEFDNIFEIQNK